MALGSWREDNAANQALQKEYQESKDPAIVERRKKEEENKAKVEAEAAISIGAASFGKTNTGDSSAYRYPVAATITDTSDYVSFEFYKYKPPFQASSNKYNESVSDEMLGEKLESILLYMPEDIQSEYGANWGGAGFGIMSKTLMAGAGNLTAGQFNLGEAFTAAGTALIGATKRKAVDEILKKANETMGTNITANQALGGTGGVVINPNVEMMFESPELRGFSLNFKMFASSEKEADMIRKICNTFKKNMLPTFGDTFIKVPNIVKVTFMTGNSPNAFVSQYKPCAISNVSINYTPDGTWATYKGGRPVATTLTLQFKELKLVYADDITVEGATY